jgi:hypothetical protein
LAGRVLFYRKCAVLRDNYSEGSQLYAYGRDGLSLKKVILNLWRIRKDLGMKTALARKGPLPGPLRPPVTEGQRTARGKRKKEVYMLWTILVVLFILWALGLFAFHAGGLIHILLVIAVIVLIVRLLQGRKIL